MENFLINNWFTILTVVFACGVILASIQNLSKGFESFKGNFDKFQEAVWKKYDKHTGEIQENCLEIARLQGQRQGIEIAKTALSEVLKENNQE